MPNDVAFGFTAKLWCYLRDTTLPLSYLYGKKYVGPITDLILSLREELYAQPYETIDWPKTRYTVAKVGKWLQPIISIMIF